MRKEYQRSTLDSEKLITTQIDTLFKKIYNKINHVTHFVQNHRKLFRTWVTSSSLKLLETEPKTQCTACLSNWNVGIVYRTCGAFLAERNRGHSKNSLNIRWIFFQSLSISSRREDLMATDLAKSQEVNITWRTIEEMQRHSSQESMTDSSEIMSSVFE